MTRSPSLLRLLHALSLAIVILLPSPNYAFTITAPHYVRRPSSSLRSAPTKPNLTSGTKDNEDDNNNDDSNHKTTFPVTSEISHDTASQITSNSSNNQQDQAQKTLSLLSSRVDSLTSIASESTSEISKLLSTIDSTTKAGYELSEKFVDVVSEMSESQERQVGRAREVAKEIERVMNGEFSRVVNDVIGETYVAMGEDVETPFNEMAFGKGDTEVDDDDDSSERMVKVRELKEQITRRTKSKEILSNWKIMPLYATATLMARFFYKAIKIPLAPVGAVTRFVTPSSGIQKKMFWDGTGSENDVRTAEMMQEKWKKSATTGSLRRSVEIWGCALSFVLKERRLTAKLRKEKITQEQFSAARSKLAEEVTQILLKLGPTFIKVGQLLSTRIDIVPKEYIEKLRLLQDNVPPFSGDMSVKIIEEELGAPITELFDTFNRTSLAAASLGQVHVATKDGKTFAVKVQRQYLRELFNVDLRNLRQLAQFLDAVDPKAEGGLLDANCQRDWVGVYVESKRLLYEEIDYLNERRNCERFAQNFDSPRFAHIRVPKTYPHLSTEKILTMEFCPGIKITDYDAIVAAGLNPVEIGVLSTQSYLEQLCRHGFFHCDPHPGNIAVEADENGRPRLIYYDFGMMDDFGRATRKGFINFLFAFYENVPREACNALEDLGILRGGPDVDRIAVERVGKDFMDRYQETLKKGGKYDNQLTEEEKRKANASRRRQLGEEFLTMNSDVPFIFPPTWTFVFRAFMSLDGIGKSLDEKNFDMTRIAKPYLKELIDLKDGNAFKTLTLKILKRFGLRPIDIDMAVTQPRRMAVVEDISKRLESGDFKLRVRALEAERRLTRADLVQSNIFKGVVATLIFNVGVMLLSQGEFLWASMSTTKPVSHRVAVRITHGFGKVFVSGAVVLGIQILYGINKLKKLDKYLEKFGVKR